MVREVAADGSKMEPEQPVLHLEIRTVRTLPSDSCRADGPRVRGGRSANTLQQNTTHPTDRTMNAQEQATNWTNTWPRVLSAPTRRIARQVRTELEPENEKSTPPIHPWISQTA
jgi:hypothetical protein